MGSYDEHRSWFYQCYADGSQVYFIPELFDLTFGIPWDGKRAVVRESDGASRDGSENNSNNDNVLCYLPSGTERTEEDENTGGEVSKGSNNLDTTDQSGEKDTEAANMATEEFTLKELADDKELWIGGSGASRHMAKTERGMINKRGARPSENFIMGKGNSAKGSIIGELLGTTDGQKIKISDVVYCPHAKFNLFSVMSMMKKGWKLRGNDKGIELIMGEGEKRKKIKFNIKAHTSKGVLYCMRIKMDRDNEVSAALADEKDEKENGKWRAVKNMENLHQELGHMSENECRKVARNMGMELTKKTMPICAACGIAKVRREDISTNKTVTFNEDDIKNKKLKINERISIDLSKIGEPANKMKNDPSLRNLQWRMIIDEATGRKFSEFYPSKDKMVEPTCEQIQL